LGEEFCDGCGWGVSGWEKRREEQGRSSVLPRVSTMPVNMMGDV
jgi:hypothetical protein